MLVGLPSSKLEFSGSCAALCNGIGLYFDLDQKCNVQGVLRCIASALGQSSALDFYSSKVNNALAHTQGVDNLSVVLLSTHTSHSSMSKFCPNVEPEVPHRQGTGGCVLPHPLALHMLGTLVLACHGLSVLCLECNVEYFVVLPFKVFSQLLS